MVNKATKVKREIKNLFGSMGSFGPELSAIQRFMFWGNELVVVTCFSRGGYGEDEKT